MSANERYITLEEFTSKYKHFSIEEDDIVLASSGNTIGKLGRIKKQHLPAIVNTSTIRFNNRISRDKIDMNYLYAYLRSKYFKNQLFSYATGSAQPNVGPTHIKKMYISYPVLSTQKIIGEILSSLDDKIELNNKINKELESLAQLLFKRWFMDFEFPNENGEPYKSSGGEMVDSELGEIPKGWNLKTLKEEFNLNMGQSPKGETFNTEGDGLIFFQGRSDFGFRFPSIRVYTNDPKKIAEKFETLISVRAPVGDINMAETKCCIGRGLGSISHPEKLNTYTYYKILSIQDVLKSYDNEGTVFGSINKETLGNIKNIIPPISTSKSFNDFCSFNDKLIHSNTIEIQELITLREYILPKLISGELQIKEN
jgi:type I restriction enzyme S subunit